MDTAYKLLQDTYQEELDALSVESRERPHVSVTLKTHAILKRYISDLDSLIDMITYTLVANSTEYPELNSYWDNVTNSENQSDNIHLNYKDIKEMHQDLKSSYLEQIGKIEAVEQSKEHVLMKQVSELNSLMVTLMPLALRQAQIIEECKKYQINEKGEENVSRTSEDQCCKSMKATDEFVSVITDDRQTERMNDNLVRDDDVLLISTSITQSSLRLSKWKIVKDNLARIRNINETDRCTALPNNGILKSRVGQLKQQRESRTPTESDEYIKNVKSENCLEKEDIETMSTMIESNESVFANYGTSAANHNTITDMTPCDNNTRRRSDISSSITPVPKKSSEYSRRSVTSLSEESKAFRKQSQSLGTDSRRQLAEFEYTPSAAIVKEESGRSHEGSSGTTGRSKLEDQSKSAKSTEVTAERCRSQRNHGKVYDHERRIPEHSLSLSSRGSVKMQQSQGLDHGDLGKETECNPPQTNGKKRDEQQQPEDNVRHVLSEHVNDFYRSTQNDVDVDSTNQALRKGKYVQGYEHYLRYLDSRTTSLLATIGKDIPTNHLTDDSHVNKQRQFSTGSPKHLTPNNPKLHRTHSVDTEQHLRSPFGREREIRDDWNSRGDPLEFGFSAGFLDMLDPDKNEIYLAKRERMKTAVDTTFKYKRDIALLLQEKNELLEINNKIRRDMEQFVDKSKDSLAYTKQLEWKVGKLSQELGSYRDLLKGGQVSGRRYTSSHSLP